MHSFFPPKQGQFSGGSKSDISIGHVSCMGRVFSLNFFDMENLANFSKNKNITRVYTRTFIYLKISQISFLSKKDKKLS